MVDDTVCFALIIYIRIGFALLKFARVRAFYQVDLSVFQLNTFLPARRLILQDHIEEYAVLDKLGIPQRIVADEEWGVTPACYGTIRRRLNLKRTRVKSVEALGIVDVFYHLLQ